MLHFHIIGSGLMRLVARGRAVHEAARTRRLLSDLPRSIQKDIGWPDAWEDPRMRGR